MPFSVTKNTIGLSIGLLVERGELDLDARVAEYWPEFAQKGKGARHRAPAAVAPGRAAAGDPGPDRGGAARPPCRRRAPRREHAVLVAGHRLRLPRHHDRQSRLGARLPRHRTHAARVLRAGDPRAARHRLLPRPAPPSTTSRKAPTLPMIRPVADASTIYASLLGPLVCARPVHPSTSRTTRSAGASGTPPSRARAPRADSRACSPRPSPASTARPVPLGRHRADASASSRCAATTRCSVSRTARTRSCSRSPLPSLAFGGPRAFGHDGAMGALACVDPDTGVAFAWTIARGPWPGGADPRALALAQRPRPHPRRLIRPARDTRRNDVTTLYNPLLNGFHPDPSRRQGRRRVVPRDVDLRVPARHPDPPLARLRDVGAHRPRRHAPRAARPSRTCRPPAAPGRRRSGTATASSTSSSPTRWGAGCCTSPRRMPPAPGATATSSCKRDGSGSVDGIDPDIAWDADGTVYITYSGLILSGAEIGTAPRHPAGEGRPRQPPSRSKSRARCGRAPAAASPRLRTCTRWTAAGT